MVSGMKIILTQVLVCVLQLVIFTYLNVEFPIFLSEIYLSTIFFILFYISSFGAVHFLKL